MTREEAISELEILKENYWDDDGYGHETKQYDDTMLALDMAIKALEQSQKIKVLDRDEAIRKLGAVDVYQASAWITLLNDLEYLGLKICEVKE